MQWNEVVNPLSPVSGRHCRVRRLDWGQMTARRQWTPEQAREWYDRQPWPVGCNYIPSNAINQLEMWQAETFDEAANDRELGWAAGLGFNTVRVYLHDLPGTQDADGFLDRIDRFL